MKKILVFGLMAFVLSACTTPTLTSPDPDIRRRAVDLRAENEGSVMANRFMDLLEKDPDNLVRAQCAHYLGKFQYKPAQTLLIKLAEDKDVFLRQDVIWSLGELRDSSALPVLIKLLEHDNNTEVRRRCAEALGKINHPGAVNGLIQQLDDVDASVSYAALQALKVITKQDFGRDAKQWEKWKESQK